MTIMKIKNFFTKHPVGIGTATIVGVFTIGVGVALAGGFVSPYSTHAEVTTTFMPSTADILQMAGVADASSASAAAASAGSASAAASSASAASVSAILVQNGPAQTISLGTGAASGSGAGAASGSTNGGTGSASGASAAAASAAAAASSASASVVISTVRPTCQLTNNGATSISWATSGATAAAIDGAAVASASSGSWAIAPTHTTTYTFVATGTGGTVTCVTTVVVPPPVQQVPACTLTVSTNNITNGGSAVLYWTGTNVTSMVIDQGVGSVSATSGSVTVYPGSSRTYTATASGQYGTVTCATSVSVNTYTPGGPTCVMSLSQYTIREGEQTSLRWEGSNVSSVFINNRIGNVSQNGVQTIAPRAGTYTYQGTFYGYNGQSITCLVTLRVDNVYYGGGNTNVTLDQLPPVQGLPLVSLYLADLPYTGLDLGPVGTMLYWLALIAWSLALAYLIFWSLVPYAFKRVTIRTNTNQQDSHAFVPAANAIADTHTSYSVSALQEPSAPAHSGYETFKSSIAKDGPLTIEDIVNGLSRTATDEHVLPLAPAHIAHTTQQVTTTVETVAPVQYPVRKEVVTAVHHDVPAFITALLLAQKDQVFGMIREMNKAGHNVEEFLTHVVVALDDAYRAKIDGTPVHAEVARACQDCAPSFLERVIASLTTVVDGSYVTGVTGVKLAVARALQSVEG